MENTQWKASHMSCMLLVEHSPAEPKINIPHNTYHSNTRDTGYKLETDYNIQPLSVNMTVTVTPLMLFNF